VATDDAISYLQLDASTLPARLAHLAGRRIRRHHKRTLRDLDQHTLKR